MAGRRGKKAAVKSGINESTLIYASMAGVLIVLAASLYIFGIDLGFVHFGGTANVNVLYGGGVACILLSYVIDIMYIKTVKRLYGAKSSYLDYVPYFNFISVFSNTYTKVSYGLVAIGFIILVPSLTPLGRFMPVDYLVLMAKNSIYILLALAVVFSIIRGYHCSKFKNRADMEYHNKISDNYGSGGKLTLVNYVIYFLPIIRSVSLFSDLNYINTVTRELEDMRRGEE